jgi:hypothetical protein
MMSGCVSRASPDARVAGMRTATRIRDFTDWQSKVVIETTGACSAKNPALLWRLF